MPFLENTKNQNPSELGEINDTTFFQYAPEEEKKRVIEEVIQKANEDQRKLVGNGNQLDVQ